MLKLIQFPRVLFLKIKSGKSRTIITLNTLNPICNNYSRVNKLLSPKVSPPKSCHLCSRKKKNKTMLRSRLLLPEKENRDANVSVCA